MSHKRALGASVSLLFLAACGGGAQTAPNVTQVNPLAIGKLQFAVGTANLYGGFATGLNVVSTYRQSNGRSAVLLNTPTITGPLTLPAAMTGQTSPPAADQFATQADFTGSLSGPSSLEVAAGAEITGTSQSVRPTTLVCDTTPTCTSNGGTVAWNTTTFGQSGGVFGMGLQPSNSTNNGVPYSYLPYPIPMYDTSGGPGGFDETTPWGGPPSYDPDGNGMGVRSGLYDIATPSGVQGVAEGVTIFEGVTAAPGTYNLSLQVPLGNNSAGTPSYGTVTAAAALATGTVTPVIAAATSPVMTEDGAGGGSFPGFTLPAGATEALIQIVDYGPGGPGAPGPTTCQASKIDTAIAPEYYTLVFHAGGATPTLGDLNGPNSSAGQGAGHLTPSATMCPTDMYTTQVIAVDYPLYEASPLFGAQSPAIVGAGGQADISISQPLLFTYGTPSAGAPSTAPLSFKRGGKALRRK